MRTSRRSRRKVEMDEKATVKMAPRRSSSVLIAGPQGQPHTSHGVLSTANTMWLTRDSDEPREKRMSERRWTYASQERGSAHRHLTSQVCQAPPHS